ncbi:MAG: hypothetical protein LBT10_08155 [Methanobrevibacter sp.]|jgi:hypothetical protein|nr:hypothetical protein [Methanobrevibacter sp.]
MNFKINGLVICMLLILSSLSIGMASTLSDGIPDTIQVDNNGYRAGDGKLIIRGDAYFYTGDGAKINGYAMKSEWDFRAFMPSDYLQEDGYLHLDSNIVDLLQARYIRVDGTKFPLSGMKKLSVKPVTFDQGAFIVNAEYINGSVLVKGGDLRTLPTTYNHNQYEVTISYEDYVRNGVYWA